MNEDIVLKLLTAAGRGDVESMQNLLQSGANVNAANDIGYTPLMSAARSYRIEMVKFLLKNGADVSASCSDGRTALHAAVAETPSMPEAQRECVKVLLETGANPNAQSETGLTPLMNAVWFRCELGVIELLQNGADISISDNEGDTAIDVAKRRGFSDIEKLLVSRVGLV